MSHAVVSPKAEPPPTLRQGEIIANSPGQGHARNGLQTRILLGGVWSAKRMHLARGGRHGRPSSWRNRWNLVERRRDVVHHGMHHIGRGPLMGRLPASFAQTVLLQSTKHPVRSAITRLVMCP